MAKKQQKLEPINKPIVDGSCKGKDTRSLILKRMLSVLIIGIVYFACSMMLFFDVLWAEILVCVGLTGLIFYHQYVTGMGLGERDCALGEILYERQEKGGTVSKEDQEHSFHPWKGFVATAVGLIPFLIPCLILAFTAQKVVYSLGVLPSWVSSATQQTNISDALSYYNNLSGASFLDILRILVRAMLMPYFTVATSIGSETALWAERFSGLLLILGPLGYGFGYRQGRRARGMVNASIKAGVDKKKRRERKEKRQRQMRRAQGPGQLN